MNITVLSDFTEVHYRSKCVLLEWWFMPSFENMGRQFNKQAWNFPRRRQGNSALVKEEQKGNCHWKASLELQFRWFWGRYLHSNTKVDHWNTGISVPADVHRSVATVWWLTFEWGAGCTEVVLRFLVYSSFIRRLYEMQGKSIFLPLCNNIYNWNN